jgi:hypothetical protein
VDLEAATSVALGDSTLYYYLPSKAMNDGRPAVTQPNTITVETQGAIELVTLNRSAQLNAVSPDMIAL